MVIILFIRCISLHESNVIIYNILDSNNVYQSLNYDSLTKEQQLSIRSVEVLLNSCLYKG